MLVHHTWYVDGLSAIDLLLVCSLYVDDGSKIGEQNRNKFPPRQAKAQPLRHPLLPGSMTVEPVLTCEPKTPKVVPSAVLV